MYDDVLQNLTKDAKKHNVMLLAHNIKQIKKRVSMESVINKYVYCYISPSDFFNENF